MASLSKLFIDRLGNVLPDRYGRTMERLKTELWKEYPQIVDPAIRDNVMDETLHRTADFERKHGVVNNLPSLIRRIFQQVVSSLLRHRYHALHESAVEPAQLEGLNAAQADSRSVEDLIYARQLMTNLDETKKQILLLRAMGIKSDKIAAELGLTKANVYQHLRRARARLKRMS